MLGPILAIFEICQFMMKDMKICLHIREHISKMFVFESSKVRLVSSLERFDLTLLKQESPPA